MLCSVKTMSGEPVEGVKVDVWETDSHGKYDVQYEDRGDKADGRAVIHTDEKGVFWFNAIVPVPYPIPNDGPVGKLLEKLGRHCWRPSHMHFMFEKEGFDHLVTYAFHSLFPSLFPFHPTQHTQSEVSGLKYRSGHYIFAAPTTKRQMPSSASKSRSSLASRPFRPKKQSSMMLRRERSC